MFWLIFVAIKSLAMIKRKSVFSLKQIVLPFIMVAMIFCVHGQETYISVHANYRGFKSFENDLGQFNHSNYTRIKGFTLKGDVFQRINNHFGVGAQMHYVVNQEHVYGFAARALFDTHWSNPNYVPILARLTNYNDRYFAQVLDYQVNFLNSFSIYGSFISDAPFNFYFDYRLSYYRIAESFVFYRAPVSANFFYPEIPELFIATGLSHKKIVPGFAVGAKPQITNRLYLDMSFSWDFVHFRNYSFGHWIPYKSFNGYHDYGYITSPLKGTKSIFNISFGIGLYISQSEI
jgi:hypothetical protein